MNILMVSSESVPFSKSGGLADVVGALSASLCDMGHDVRIMVPSYNTPVTESGELLCKFAVPMLGNSEQVEIRRKTVGKVNYDFVCHSIFNDRKGIYGDTSFLPYQDNCSRFTLLCKSALLYCEKLNWKPQVIHCHDWATGFIPYFIKVHNNSFFMGTKTVFTIHNLAYQGNFARMDFMFANVKPNEGLFKDNQVNMMQSALVFSDFITTVSPTYSKEIQTPAQGDGLDELLVKRSRHLKGIVNGIDVNEWSPEKDKFLDFHFSLNKMEGKAKLKEQIQKEFSLEVNPNIPIFAMISRLASQKGFDALTPVLEEICTTMNLQFVIIGTGDKNLEDALTEIGKRNKNLSVNILFSNKLAHLVEAGSDFFLMPSRYEPCGLNQLYSLRYGTIPIARKTGGLADTILDIDEYANEGTGFLFEDLTSENIKKHVSRAVEIYNRKTGNNTMEKIRYRAMNQDFSWNKSAKMYLEVYESIQDKKNKN
ncbi:MAG: glycogen synthase [Sphaerochaetaceae bacterium]|nr:glycogen synthase [Sphaerochaetaceae bacterium]